MNSFRFKRAAEYLLGFQVVIVSFRLFAESYLHDPGMGILFIIAFAWCLYISPDLFKGLLTRAENKGGAA